MRNYTLCLTIALASSLLILLCAACGNDDNEGSLIPDPRVRGALAHELKKASNEEITTDELATITGLYIWGYASDLTGLEYCVNLTYLHLDFFGFISDLSPLSNLTNLRELYLSGQKITDISPLAELTNLTTLDLRGNQISNISSLARLTSLTELTLSDNDISDISPLVRLTNLTDLGLGYNQISDISPLAGFVSNLVTLGLGLESGSRPWNRSPI